MPHIVLIAEKQELARALADRLLEIADVTKVLGIKPNSCRNAAPVSKVSEDLAHGYMLVFQPPAAEDHAMHPITVQVRAKGDKVRAREGYYPE